MSMIFQKIFALSAVLVTYDGGRVGVRQPELPVLASRECVAGIRGDSVPKSDAPSALTDASLQQWHTALLALADTLAAHPELQKIPELAPLIRNMIKDDVRWSDVLKQPVDTAYAIRQAVLPTFPIQQVAEGLRRHQALASALMTAHITPTKFVTIFSEVLQFECANYALYDTWSQTGKWGNVDPQSVLGQNLAFFRAQRLTVANAEHGHLAMIRAEGREKTAYILCQDSLSVEQGCLVSHGFSH